MLKQRSGNIINMELGIVGVKMLGEANYAASKAGINRFHKICSVRVRLSQHTFVILLQVSLKLKYWVNSTSSKLEGCYSIKARWYSEDVTNACVFLASG
jgi:3-oxoacyl-[acyl-carrier protein] reductase